MSKGLRTAALIVGAVALVATGLGAAASAGLIGSGAGAAATVAGVSAATLSSVGTLAGVAAAGLGLVSGLTAKKPHRCDAIGDPDEFSANSQSADPNISRTALVRLKRAIVTVTRSVRQPPALEFAR